MSNGRVLWQQALPISLKDTIETNENLVSKGFENKREVWNLFRFRAFRRLKLSAAASTRHCGHRHLVLGLWSLLFASMTLSCYGVQACRLPALKPVKYRKMFRGSFDKALWPQAYRALKPAVCLHGPLLLGRSSLPFARPQTPKMFRGSFDQALWPQAFGLGALKPAVCLHGPLLLPFMPTVCLPSNSSNHENVPRQLRPGTLATGIWS